MKELATALVKAQAEMENASKDSANPFFKSKYADLNSVMGAIKPCLSKHGLGFVQVCHDAPDCAKVETVIVHESGEQFSCGTISVPVSKGDAQGYGSALTYARRYSLATAFGVGAEDDDGNAAAKAAPVKESAKTVAQASADQLTASEKVKAQEIADCVRAELNEKGSAPAAVLWKSETEGMDATLVSAAWGLLASDERAAIKKAGQERKAA